MLDHKNVSTLPFNNLFKNETSNNLNEVDHMFAKNTGRPLRGAALANAQRAAQKAVKV